MKHIVTVGGSSGIGLAVIQNLQNCDIVNISRSPCAVAGVRNIQADVTDPNSLKRAFRSLDKIDVLIYCAGASLAAPVEYVEHRDYRYIFDVNILGAIDCCKLAIPKLKESENAKIIILGSSGGVAPIAYDSFYSATKSGIISLCTALRLELPQIKSTAVVIGGTQTRFSFKRKIYTDCGEYDKELKQASDALIKTEQTGYSANDVAVKIAQLVGKKDPPPVVTIGAKNKFMLWLYKILPWRLKLSALRATYNI